jgi:transposase
MKESIKFVGLDVHKETIAVAIAESGASDVRYLGEIPNTPESLAKLVRQIKAAKTSLSFCYEAGGCGYGIYRQLRSLKHTCAVVAPALIPKKAGDRVKTDRRDSVNLARLHRAGELTAIQVPTESQEALRDLTRAREDLKQLQRQAKQRLLAFLLRHGRRYGGRSFWTQAHFRWLETVKFEQPAQQIVLQEYIDTILACGQRVLGLEQIIAQTVQSSAERLVIEAVMALRGLSLIAATTVIAEIGDLRRFARASQLMAYLGLVPSEHSSGGKRCRGSITKTGNSHVRRVLVEAAWTYRHPARKSALLQRRAERTTPAIQAIAWAAQKRLCQRYRHLMGSGKQTVQACTAVARELAGFIWAVGQTVSVCEQPVGA